MTWHAAIQEVLGASRTPLNYKQITERILEQGPQEAGWGNPGGYGERSDLGVHQARRRRLSLLTGGQRHICTERFAPSLRHPLKTRMTTRMKWSSHSGLSGERDKVSWRRRTLVCLACFRPRVPPRPIRPRWISPVSTVCTCFTTSVKSSTSDAPRTAISESDSMHIPRAGYREGGVGSRGSAFVRCPPREDWATKCSLFRPPTEWRT